jgi:hypothetical protein
VSVEAVLVNPVGELVAQPAGRHTFEAVHEFAELHGGRVFDQQIHVVVFAVEFDQCRGEVDADLAHHLLAAGQ